MDQLDGNPTGIAYYKGQERFSDGAFNVVNDEDWTAELALTACRALDLPTREGQVDRIRDAVDDGLLPLQAVEALVAPGWTELDE